MKTLEDLEAQAQSLQTIPDNRERERTQHAVSHRFKLHTIDDVLHLPSPEWRVQGLLPVGALTMIYAPQAQFKTFFAIDLALSVATGFKFHGRTVKQGPVVYVLGEGRGGLKNRVRSWLVEHGLQTIKQAFFVVEAVQFKSQKDVDMLRMQIDALNVKPAMLFIDTFARSAVGLDENDATQIGLWIDAVTDLKHQMDLDVVAVHHAQKASTNGSRVRERGSSAFIGAVDTVVRLERKPATGKTIWVSCEKQKDAEEFEEFALAVKVIPLGVNEHGDETSSCVLVEANASDLEGGPSSEQVLILCKLYLSPEQRATRQDLMRETGLADRTFDRYREQLEDRGLLETIKRGVFRITDDGIAAIATDLPMNDQGNPSQDVAANTHPLIGGGGDRTGR